MYTGRAVVELARDPSYSQSVAGTSVPTSDIAWNRGFTDIDGTQPASELGFWFLADVLLKKVFGSTRTGHLQFGMDTLDKREL